MDTPTLMNQLSITERPCDEDEDLSDCELSITEKACDEYGDDYLCDDESDDDGGIFWSLTVSNPYIYLPGRTNCYMIVNKRMRKETIIPCANKVLEEYNIEHKTDYKIFRCERVSVLKEWIGRFHIHCNFVAKAERKPLKEEKTRIKYFFADANLEDGSCVVNFYAPLIDDDFKCGCEMCPEAIIHPASFQGRPTS